MENLEQERGDLTQRMLQIDIELRQINTVYPKTGSYAEGRKRRQELIAEKLKMQARLQELKTLKRKEIASKFEHIGNLLSEDVRRIPGAEDRARVDPAVLIVLLVQLIRKYIGSRSFTQEEDYLVLNAATEYVHSLFVFAKSEETPKNDPILHRLPGSFEMGKRQ